MNIQIFTDLRFTTNPTPTGVGKHIFQMASGLAALPEKAVHLSALVAGDQLALHRSGNLSFLPGKKLPLPWKASEVVWNLTGHPAMDRWTGRPDWIYCPKNDFIPIRDSRVAVTVHGAHDLDPGFPQSSKLPARLNRARKRLTYGRMLQQADLVLSVSEFLKRQMMDWFDVPEEKFCVVGNGVEPEFFQAADLPEGSSGQCERGPYVLCVGGLNRMDGGDRMLALAAALQARLPEMRLLIAGKDHEAQLLARAPAHTNLKLLGYTRPAQLAALMRDALALFFPTRYETFGIAAAEAMAAGTPVITCRSTAVPEVVGEAGIYVDPDAAGESAEVVIDLDRNSTLRRQYAEAGNQKAQAYYWEACVQRLIAAFAACK